MHQSLKIGGPVDSRDSASAQIYPYSLPGAEPYKIGCRAGFRGRRIRMVYRPISESLCRVVLGFWGTPGVGPEFHMFRPPR